MSLVPPTTWVEGMPSSPETSTPPLAWEPQRPAWEVREVDPSSARDTAWAAQLHRQLFTDIGLIAQLGERVLQRFCYGRLIKDGLMRAALALVADKPAGLITFTKDSKAVHRAALGSHIAPALREVVIATILAPRILLGVPGAARLLYERRNEQLGDGAPVAEVLALGVREEYRNREFLRTTGIRLSDSLLHYALVELKASGVTEGRGVILTSNRPALAFCRLRASRVRPYDNAAHPSIEVWYNIDEALNAMNRRVAQRNSNLRTSGGCRAVAPE